MTRLEAGQLSLMAMPRVSGSSMYEGYGNDAFPNIAQKSLNTDSIPVAALVMLFFINAS
jgi:hypothetical protein